MKTAKKKAVAKKLVKGAKKVAKAMKKAKAC